MSFYNSLLQSMFNIRNCHNCKCYIDDESIIKDHLIYCSSFCYKQHTTQVNIVLKDDTQSPVKTSKSISYICNGCKEKFYESEKPRIEKYGNYWCSDQCTSSIMLNSYIKRQNNLFK